MSGSIAEAELAETSAKFPYDSGGHGLERTTDIDFKGRNKECWQVVRLGRRSLQPVIGRKDAGRAKRLERSCGRAAEHGDRIAIVSGNQHTSYAELDNRVDRLAAGFLKLGIKARERVIVQLPNIAPFFDTIFALFRIGAIPSSPCLFTAGQKSYIYAASAKRPLILFRIRIRDMIIGT